MFVYICDYMPCGMFICVYSLHIYICCMYVCVLTGIFKWLCKCISVHLHACLLTCIVFELGMLYFYVCVIFGWIHEFTYVYCSGVCMCCICVCVFSCINVMCAACMLLCMCV